MLTRFPEIKEELQLLVNILSIKVADVDVVHVGLNIYGRRREEYIKSRKSEMGQGIEEWTE